MFQRVDRQAPEVRDLGELLASHLGEHGVRQHRISRLALSELCARMFTMRHSPIQDAVPVPARRPTGAGAALDLEPFTSAELDALFRGGEAEADFCEAILARAARGRGAVDVALAEGLHALRQGDRLPQLGCHLDDYAREVLDLGRRAAEELARLGRELGSRPLLREALRSGRVRLRAAQTVLGVAQGADERVWVERAARLTVRELEERVRRAGALPADEDEAWLTLRTTLDDEERAAVDEALELAGELMPGSSRVEQVEAIAQELAGVLPAHPDIPDADHLRELGGALRPIAGGSRERERAAELETETERWPLLSAVPEVPVPGVPLDAGATAQELDAALRELARLRAQWDDVVGYCGLAVKKSRLYQLLGFASFRHYCEERLGLSARSVEQRAALEERRWRSPELREAKRQGLPFEKLRLLARLPDGELGSWTPRAHALTCVELRRALEGEAERQLRAHRTIRVPLPLRIAALLAAAVHTLRQHLGTPLSTGTCLALLAQHFVDTWRRAVKFARTLSRKARDRDGGECQVPGCSHRAAHAHHVLFRSQGGDDAPENLVPLCAYHHLRCLHGGFLGVTGRAPALRWSLLGEPWDGPRP